MQAIRRHQLSKHWLLRLVEGREALLERPQFRTCQELEAHCDQSNVPLYYLTLQALGACSSHSFTALLLLTWENGKIHKGTRTLQSSDAPLSKFFLMFIMGYIISPNVRDKEMFTS